jgi:hypothetical protein
VVLVLALLLLAVELASARGRRVEERELVTAGGSAVAADAGTRTARGLGERATWRDRFSDAVRDAGIAMRDKSQRAPTRLS